MLKNMEYKQESLFRWVYAIKGYKGLCNKNIVLRY